LERNVCINEEFKDPTKMAVLQQTVDEKCKFDESTDLLKSLKSELNDVKEECQIRVSEFQMELSSTKSTCRSDIQQEKNQCKLQLDDLKVDKTELKAEKLQLKLDVQAEKVHCQNQTSLFRELQTKLEFQWKKTCISETRELRNNFDFKLKENSELLDNLQQKEAEIKEKKAEIERMKRKMELLEASEG
jgi:chromosome segregation ATPase